MIKPTDDELDFTGGFAAYKPPPGAPVAPAAAAPSPGTTRNLDQAAAQISQQLEREGFHILAARKASGEPRPRSVFLVEEDSAVAARITKTLASAGIETLVARDARTTSRMLSRSAAPGMFLVNVGLPGGVDGFTLLRLLRKHPALGAVPVAMFTMHHTHGEIIHALMGGADGYVMKSCPPEVLLKAVRTILGD